jgi:hypothetical protein
VYLFEDFLGVQVVDNRESVNTAGNKVRLRWVSLDAANRARKPSIFLHDHPESTSKALGSALPATRSRARASAGLAGHKGESYGENEWDFRILWSFISFYKRILLNQKNFKLKIIRK